jgi:pimeloyl-ACP methyl ester carboxylesterase
MAASIAGGDMTMLRRIAIGLAALLLLLGALGLGALYAAGAPDLPIRELEARYGAPPVSHYIEVDGMRLHYRDEGPRDAPVLLLLHGFGASLHTWDGWVAALGDTYRIIRLDLPGHGLTGPYPDEDRARYQPEAMAQVVDRFMATLGVARFSIGGNSMGGGISWRYTVLQPNKIEKLILVDAAGYPREEPRPAALRVLGWPVIGALLGNIAPQGLMRKNVESVYGNPALVSDDLVARYRDLALRPGNRAAARAIMTQEPDARLVPQIKDIKQPVLILWGARDSWVLPKYDARFKADLPAATLIMYEDLGHVPMEEAPARTAADARRFLGG